MPTDLQRNADKVKNMLKCEHSPVITPTIKALN